MIHAADGRLRPIAALILLAAVLLAYQPAWHGGLLWDDDANVTAPGLRSLQGLRRIWFEVGATQQYYPMLHTAFWIEHRLWGDRTVGYHLANVVQHLLSALLLAAILRRLEIPGTALAAAVFALHPVHVESVAWITQQKNTLSGVFFFASALTYLRFDETRRPAWYAAALAAFAAALLSKTSTAPLPAAILIILWWRRGGLSPLRDASPLLPFFALGAAAGLFTAWVEVNVVGAGEGGVALGLVERGLVAGRAFWFYIGKVLWPSDLIFIYPRWVIDRSAWVPYLYPAAALTAAAAAWAFRRRTRWPPAALLYHSAMLFPAMGFFDLYAFRYSYVADHWSYLAGVGAITVFTAGFTALMERLRSRFAVAALCLALLGTLGGLTWRQSRMYADVETLYRTTIARNPDCRMALNNLGIVLSDSGRSDEAVGLIRRAVALKPDDAEAHNNLGVALAAAGRIPEAVESYRETLRLDPGYTDAHTNLGVALVAVGEVSEAIEHHEAAIRIRPDFVKARNNLGLALAAAGRIPEAVEQYEAALRLRPDLADLHYNLGNALVAAGRFEEAVGRFERALSLDPSNQDARNNLGAALYKAGRIPEAIDRFREALRTRPDDARARRNLETAVRALNREVGDESPPDPARR